MKTRRRNVTECRGENVFCVCVFCVSVFCVCLFCVCVFPTAWKYTRFFRICKLHFVCKTLFESANVEGKFATHSIATHSIATHTALQHTALQTEGWKPDGASRNFLTKYQSSESVKKNEMGGTCSTYERDRRSYSMWIGKPEGMRPLAKPMHKSEDNIKMYF
jgi:hypothetical protein